MGSCSTRIANSKSRPCFSQKTSLSASHSWVWMMYCRRVNKVLPIESWYNVKNLCRTSGSRDRSPSMYCRSTFKNTSCLTDNEYLKHSVTPTWVGQYERDHYMVVTGWAESTAGWGKTKDKELATSFLYICATGLTYHPACNCKRGETPSWHKYVTLTWLYQSKAGVADLGISFPTLLAQLESCFADQLDPVVAGT